MPSLQANDAHGPQGLLEEEEPLMDLEVWPTSRG